LIRLAATSIFNPRRTRVVWIFMIRAKGARQDRRMILELQHKQSGSVQRDGEEHFLLESGPDAGHGPRI
jgi:hypothetical protein